jgi:mRNA interferase RelE/StbE
MAYHVIIKRRAEKEIAKLDPKTRTLIAYWIRDNLEGCENPKAVGDGKKLESVEGGWRWCIGSYRVLAVIDAQDIVIELFRVGHRKDAYRGL